MQTTTRYEVVYTSSYNGASKVVGTYSTLKRARRAVDRKDAEVGGYRHTIREIQVTA